MDFIADRYAITTPHKSVLHWVLFLMLIVSAERNLL